MGSSRGAGDPASNGGGQARLPVRKISRAGVLTQLGAPRRGKFEDSVGPAIPKQGNYWTADPARRSCGRANGRATSAAPDRRLPSRARQDVRRLQAHQVVFTPVPLRIGGETIRVPEPGTF